VRSAKAAAERDVAGETHPSDPWVCAHRIGVLAGFCVPWFQGSFIAASLCAHGCAYACVYMWEGGGCSTVWGPAVQQCVMGPQGRQAACSCARSHPTFISSWGQHQKYM
jgi:hypothetical protein